MGKVLRCRDVGVDCDFEVHGKDETDILSQAAEHAKSCHNAVQMTPALQAKIKSAIQEEPAGGGCCGGSCH